MFWVVATSGTVPLRVGLGRATRRVALLVVAAPSGFMVTVTT